MLRSCRLLLPALLMVTTSLFAQPPAPGDGHRLEQGLSRLNQELASLLPEQRQGVAYVDAAACSKAADWILRHQEFYKPQYAKSVDKVLELGLQRIEGIRQGKTDWGRSPGGHALAYKSRVDGSLQPYGLTLPAGFSAEGSQRWPLYVVLHGRNGTLTEASFMAGFEGKAAPENQGWIQLDVFGRTNNAYRWAGETDVFEAIADVVRRYRIDEQRITLWGFSMGGAGAWHLGVHHPSKWASVGAGAGFVDYYAYQKKSVHLPEPLHQLLGIYDTVNYALNLSNVPFITYGGEEDPQLQASLTMQNLAREVNAPLQLLVGPKMGHKFDDASLATFMEFLGKHNQEGRPLAPGKPEIRFTTRTLKYNQCEWLTIQEQQVPFEPSTVTSKLTNESLLEISTENVQALSIDRGITDRVQIDGGEPVRLSTAADGSLPEVYFVQGDEGWQVLDYDDSIAFADNTAVHKRRNLQGPIDDAFMEPFVCVRGTGTPWSMPLQNYSEFVLHRFALEHDKYLRGQVPVVSDVHLSEEDLASRNLILLGDPGSNQVLARILDKLPLQWTPEQFSLAGTSYSPATHAPVMVFPNPLNPRRYVVINSGMTMHARDFEASNANLFPKLGDYGVIRFGVDSRMGMSEETVSSGMFDAYWRLSK